MSYQVNLSADNELVIKRIHTTGDTILVIRDGGIMVEYTATRSKNKSWWVFNSLERENTIQESFELFNKEK